MLKLDVGSWKALDDHTTTFYDSEEFAQKAQEASTFLQDLQPYLDGRVVSLENMVGRLFKHDLRCG